MKISKALYLISSLLLFSGAFYSTELMKWFSLFFFGLTVFIFFLLPIIGGKKNTQFDSKGILMILFSLVFFTMLLSSVINKSLELFIGVVLFFLIFINFSIFNINRTVYEFFDKPIKLLFLVVTLVNLYFGFSIPFKGAFSNPNSLGGIYAMISFMATGVLLDKTFNENKKKYDYILLIIILLSAFFTLVSNSRISFISSCLCLFFIFIYYFFDSFNFKNGFYVNLRFFKKMIAIFVILITSLVVFWDKIENIFLKKMVYKMDDGGGVTGGRDEVWYAIFNNSLIFGHGRYSPHLDYLNLAAHNTFLSIYDQFGWLSSLLFLLSIFILILSYFYNGSLKKYGVTPFFIVFGFVFLSISESMINKTIMFAFLMIINLPTFRRRDLL